MPDAVFLYPTAGGGFLPCSPSQAEAIAFVLRSVGAKRPAAAASAEELVVRLCSSAKATTAALRARRAGNAHAHLRTTADFNNPLDQTKMGAAVTAELGELSRTATNGQGKSRFQTLTDLNERPRTYFPKSSANTPSHTPSRDRGRRRTHTNDPELCHLDAMRSSIQAVTAVSTQTTVLPPTEIWLGKVPASIQG